MLKAKRICEYKGVDTTVELCQSTIRANEIVERSLKQLKLVPLGIEMICQIMKLKMKNSRLLIPYPLLHHMLDLQVVLEDNITNMNKRLEELFLLSNSRHEEDVGLIREIDTRISHLEHWFDEEFTHDDDMSAEF
ncbi:hypothetical protein DEO72_LG4g1210 [Vigna unguiculata]|uniref:Uncharacterized protein n=1 Tax=Vigna unguiculata TaxID=3917 RepID=A0A4D6LPE7_VIGUN|nr:hypothetical protein DEO72_LG4g1210 [Vigna unguiculata]